MGKDFRKRFCKNRMAVAGSVIVIVLFAVSLLAPWLVVIHHKEYSDLRLRKSL